MRILVLVGSSLSLVVVAMPRTNLINLAMKRIGSLTWTAWFCSWTARTACKLRFCTRCIYWFRWSDSYSWGSVGHLWDQWERISILRRSFIVLSEVYRRTQSTVLHSKHFPCCCSRRLSFAALGLTCGICDFVGPHNLCGSSPPGYRVIASHSLPMLLQWEPLFLKNSLLMPWQVQCKSRHTFPTYVHIVLVSQKDTTSIISQYKTCSSICALASLSDLGSGIMMKTGNQGPVD